MTIKNVEAILRILVTTFLLFLLFFSGFGLWFFTADQSFGLEGLLGLGSAIMIIPVSFIGITFSAIGIWYAKKNDLSQIFFWFSFVAFLPGVILLFWALFGRIGYSLFS